MLEGYFVRTLGHAPRLQQRVHAHAPRRGQRGLPAGHQGDPGVRPGDPQALRQLHEQPRREDRGRAVRQGRQVLRRRDAARDAARPADVRPRPVRGLRREVRHGVPAGDPRRARRRAGWSSATSARSSRCSTAAATSPRPRTSCSTTSATTSAASTRTSSPTPTAPAARGRWSSTTTGSPRRPAGSATPPPTRSRSSDGSKRLVRRTLAEGLGLADGAADDRWLAFREQRSGLEYLRPVAEIRERGLHVGCARTRRGCTGRCASCTTPPACGGGSPSGSAAPACPRSRRRSETSSLDPCTPRSGA